MPIVSVHPQPGNGGMPRHIRTVACLLIALLMFWARGAYAKGRCPPGQYPVGGQGVGGCAPIPGYGGNQTAQPAPPPIDPGRYEDAWA